MNITVWQPAGIKLFRQFVYNQAWTTPLDRHTVAGHVNAQLTLLSGHNGGDDRLNDWQLTNISGRTWKLLNPVTGERMPTGRMSTITQFKKSIPAYMRTALEKIDKIHIELRTDE